MENRNKIVSIITALLMALCISMVSGCSVYDKLAHQWKFDCEEVAEAIVDKDAEDLSMNLCLLTCWKKMI